MPLTICAALVAGCAAAPPGDPWGLAALPPTDELCRAAQRIVTRTDRPVELVVHEDFDAFVKSKAVIAGPTIQQYNWYDQSGEIVGVSCKIKSADHLNLAFGGGTAGPDGLCQDFHRAVYALVREQLRSPAWPRVVFDPNETIANEDEPGMTGPDWLEPYTATLAGDDGALVIRAKGFQVNFTDPQFEKAPARFRGIHYCHFVAPGHLRALLEGEVPPGLRIGRSVRPQPAAR